MSPIRSRIVTDDMDYCIEDQMVRPWKGGLPGSHKLLREEVSTKTSKVPKSFVCIRCGVDVMKETE